MVFSQHNIGISQSWEIIFSLFLTKKQLKTGCYHKTRSFDCSVIKHYRYTYNCSVLIALLYRYYTGSPYFTQVIYGSTSFCLPLPLRLNNKTLLGRLYNSDIFIEAEFGFFIFFIFCSFFCFLFFFCINITRAIKTIHF